MGHKVQSRAGDSLVEVYDVKGSQAPIEKIDIADVKGVHELGETIFSERFSVFQRRAEQSGNQSAIITKTMEDLPAGAVRLLGLTVFTDDASRLDDVAVSLQDDQASPQSIPIWIWDGTNTVNALFSDVGIVAVKTVLVPSAPLLQMPNMFASGGQPQSIIKIMTRSTTNAFGAGTVKVVLIAYLGFAAIGGISSRGLPIPSW